MGDVSFIGLDQAKHVLQAHGGAADGPEVFWRKAILARAVNVAFQKQNLLFVSRTVRVRYAKRQFAVVAERAVRLALGLDCKMRAQRGPPDPGSCGKPRSGGGYLPSRRFPDETRYRPDHSCACHPWPTRAPFCRRRPDSAAAGSSRIAAVFRTARKVTRSAIPSSKGE